MRILAASVGLALIGTVYWTSTVRAQVGLETPSAGLRDSSEAGGTRINTSPDKDLAPVTPDITGAATQSPLIRGQLQEDVAERQMLMQRRLENDVKIPAGTVGSYDLSAGAAYGGDQWRFVYYNSHWWYWQPNNTWAIFYRNQWIPYNASTYNQYFANSRSPRGNMLGRTGSVMPRSGAAATGGQIGPNFLPGEGVNRVQSGYRGNPAIENSGPASGRFDASNAAGPTASGNGTRGTSTGAGSPVGGVPRAGTAGSPGTASGSAGSGGVGAAAGSSSGVGGGAGSGGSSAAGSGGAGAGGGTGAGAGSGGAGAGGSGGGH